MLSESLRVESRERERERGRLVRADRRSTAHHHKLSMIPDHHHTDNSQIQTIETKANSCIDESLESTRRMIAFCEEVRATVGFIVFHPNE